MKRTSSAHNTSGKSEPAKDPSTRATPGISVSDICTLEAKWEAFVRKSQTPEAAKDLVGTLREYTDLLEEIQHADQQVADVHQAFQDAQKQKQTHAPPPTEPRSDAHRHLSIDALEQKRADLESIHAEAVHAMMELPHGQQGGGDRDRPSQAPDLGALLRMQQQETALHTDLMHALDKGFRVELASESSSSASD